MEENMRKIDVFLSYEHTLKSVVDKICYDLEKDGIRCWYAPRDVVGDYATSIVNAIDEASVFVVLLNKESSQSAHVLNEVEMAYRRIIEKQGELTILPFKLDDRDLSKAMEYYVKRMHWIDASSQGIDDAVNELKSKIKAIILPYRERINEPLPRRTNMYFDEKDVKEKKRLKTQQKILEKFDKACYDEIAASMESMRILDLGSNNGDFIMDRLGNKENTECLVGLEYNAEAVAKAQQTYGNEKIRFVQCNLDGESVADTIGSLTEQYRISDFNIVNISMLLLHLSDPLKLMRVLRKFMKPGAIVIIKDIDDGYNIAYPDPEGIFSHAISLCAKDPMAGYRNSGRQVFNILHKAGYRDIKLLKCGLDTTAMNYDEKEALFHTYFSFIKSDYEIFRAGDPDNAAMAESAGWFDEHYAEMEDAFLEDSFFFSLGFMLFTAKR